MRPSVLLTAAALLAATLSAQSPAWAHDEHGKLAAQESPRSEDPSMRGAYGGPIMLQDQTGKTVTDEDYRGKFLLISFGYTHCGDICPTMLQSTAKVMDLLGDKAKELQPIFITLDPQRDTPQVLRDYVSAFHPGIVGLTGPEPYVASAARKYRIKYEKVPGVGNDYSIDHSAVLFLMGPDGAFMERFAYSMTPEDMTKRITKRINETPKPDSAK